MEKGFCENNLKYSNVSELLRFVSGCIKDANESIKRSSQSDEEHLLSDEQFRQSVRTIKAMQLIKLPDDLLRYENDGGFVPTHAKELAQVLADEAEESLDNNLFDIDDMLQIRDNGHIQGNILDHLASECEQL